MTHTALRTGVVAATAAALLLTGCSAPGSDQQNLTFSLYMTADSPARAVYEKLIADFTQETGVAVDMTYDTTNYENNIKVKMAANNLPDVFATHGWSVLRYSEFLQPLDDQPWTGDVNTALNTSMRDDQGHLYALPVEYTVAGIAVNQDVVEKAGVDATAIKTWDDFHAALTKVAATGVTPITASGKSSSAGNMADFIASNAFTDAQRESFLGGTFDTAAWSERVLSHVEDWRTAGFFNADYVSASLDDMASQLAQGQAAFALVPASSILATTLKLNPSANIGFIPIPSDESERFLVGGEGIHSFGVSKAGKNKEAALKFVAFLAEPEHAAAIASALGSYSGLTNVKVDLGVLQSSYDAWVTPAQLPTKPFFDRVYLPNGIWSTMIATTDSVITGQASPDQASEQMKLQYDTLFSQAR